MYKFNTVCERCLWRCSESDTNVHIVKIPRFKKRPTGCVIIVFYSTKNKAAMSLVSLPDLSTCQLFHLCLLEVVFHPRLLLTPTSFSSLLEVQATEEVCKYFWFLEKNKNFSFAVFLCSEFTGDCVAWRFCYTFSHTSLERFSFSFWLYFIHSPSEALPFKTL